MADAAYVPNDFQTGELGSMMAMAMPLGRAQVGFRGRVQAIAVHDTSSGLPAIELETRLIELGFVEGAPVEVLHEGTFGGDPIAVRIADTTIALRRREAMAILVEGTAS